MEKKIKKKIILYLSLLLVVFLIIGVSYAYFQATSGQTTTNTINTLTCFTTSITDATSALNLTGEYPIPDAEGLQKDPYTFTVTNNCPVFLTLQIGVESLTTSTIDSSHIKVSIVNHGITPTTGTILSSNTAGTAVNGGSAYIITTSDLRSNESKSFDLRIWLDENTTNAEAFNKVYNGKVIVTSSTATLPTHLLVKLPSSPVGLYSTTFTGASWNNKTASLEVTSISSSGKNTINLTNIDTSSSTNFASYIIGLSGSTQGTGQVVNENGYRYEGKDPNNYVSFNGELWRIIGVFDSNTHGIASTNLVKIIRDEPIGGLAWDKNGTNDWPNSSMYHLLNDYYYNGTNESTPTYCYGFSTSVPANCDFTYNGITNSTYRSMIQSVTWHLGAMSLTSTDANYYATIVSNWYTYERGTTVYSGRSTTSTGNIGLMYMSDYGYSVLASSCARTTTMNSYSSSACAGQSWLYGNGDEWTIVPNCAGSNSVWYVNAIGNANDSSAGCGYAGSPVLYLKSDVKIYGGNGSKNNPYAITE